MCRAWYSTSGVAATCVSYSARSSASVGLRSLRYFCADACCSTLRRTSSRRVATSASFVEAVLLGLLRDQLDAHQVLLDLLALFRRQLAGGLPARRPSRSPRTARWLIGLPLTVTSGGFGGRRGRVAPACRWRRSSSRRRARAARPAPRMRITFIWFLRELEKFYFQSGLSRARVDRQRVDVPAHQFGGGSIDHPVSLHRGHAGERRGRDLDVKMPAFARAGMAGMLGAVVADLEQRRAAGLQRRAQPLDALLTWRFLRSAGSHAAAST